MIFRISVILSILFCAPDLGLAQVSITPNSANACACDGQINFSSPPLAASYNLFDAGNSLIDNGVAPGGIFNINGLCPDVYTLEVIQNADTNQYYVNVNSIVLNPGNATSTSICSTDGSANLNTLIPGIAAGGVWISPSGSTGLTMPLNAEFMEDGWYQYSVTSGACNVITGVFVDFIQNADPGLTTTYEICETYVPFPMIDFMQGDPDPGGQWYDSSGNLIDGFYYPATMNSGLFTYVIDTVPGCSPVFRTMNIDENSQPFAGNDTQISVCEDGVPFNMLQQLTGNPDAGGQWTSPLNTPVAGTFNPATYPEGTYRYLLTANAPCIADQALLTITFLNDDPSGESASIALCENAANLNLLQQLNGNPTPGGIWTNPLGQITDNTFDPAVEISGTYNYVFPNVGCSPAGADLDIVVENLHNAGNDNSTTTCLSASNINLNSLLSFGAELGGTWNNNLGQNVSNLFDPSSGVGSYSFNYNVSGGLCPPDQSVITVLVQDAPPLPGDLSLEFCSEDLPVDLNSYYPAIPNILFENNSGASVSSIFNPASGDQTIVAVNPSANGCPDSESDITIQVNFPLFEEDTLTQNVCSTEGTFNLNELIGAQAIGAGDWYDNNNQPIDNIIQLEQESIDFYRYVLDQPQSCGSSQLYVELVVNTPLEAGENANASFCSTDAPQSLVSLLPASASGVGIWSLNGLPFNNNIIDPATDISGEYYYVVPQNGNCPSDFAILNVSIQNGIQYSAGNDIEVCSDNGPVSMGQPLPPSAICTWNPTQYLSDGSAPMPQFEFSGNTSSAVSINYTVDIIDGQCEYQDEIQVTVNPLPEFSLNAPSEICRGETVTLTPDVVGNYSWSPAFLFENPSAATQILELQGDASITCEVTSNEGCEFADTISIVVNQLPFLQIFPEISAGCPPLEISMTYDETSTGIANMEWNIPGYNIFSGDTLETVLTMPGIYNLEGTAYTEEGCSVSILFNNVFEVYQNPVAQFDYTPAELSTLDPVANFEDQSFDAWIYSWDFSGLGESDEAEPIFEFPSEEPANFDVCLKVINQQGCSDSTCRIIHLDNQHVIFVPNAFTPDGDGLNDVFLPVLKGFDESTYTFQVFDRWGEMIFTTNEISQPWTGDVLNGTHFAKDDVYHWQILVKDKEQAEYRKFRGLVTLLR